MAKKPFALRIDEETMKGIEKWAADEQGIERCRKKEVAACGI